MEEDEKPLFIMVAGPNGSGKSTLISKLLDSGFELGTYLCPDIFVKKIVSVRGMSDLDKYRQAQDMTDQQRKSHLGQKKPHTIETVFSHPSKLDYISEAKKAGFDVDLHFIGLAEPLLNVERVCIRVAQGGHDVPRDKIIARYKRSIAQLPAAIRLADYVRVYDNSTDAGHQTLLEFENGEVILQHVSTAEMPDWVKQQLFSHLE